MCHIMYLVQVSCILGLLISCSTALRVTPGSPCVPFCPDLAANNGFASNPNSSHSTNEDVPCYDSQYALSPAGQEFQKCMTCLQDSPYSRGDESDQLWFLYNLRQTFDNCIFGFPSATSISSAGRISASPCSASLACESLEAAFTESNPDSDHQNYSYCDADGGVLTSSSVTKCESCIEASDDQGYLVNYLVALEAGCSQRPSPGTRIGLSNTVFSINRISATDPTSKETQSVFPTATVIGIAVGGLAVLIAMAGFSFFCCRRRRNKRIQLESDRRPSSPLSFCCQTRLPEPCSPVFMPGQYDTTTQEKNYSLPLRSPTEPPQSRPASSAQSQTTIPSFSRPRLTPRPLPAISTKPPTVPDNVHYSTSPKSSQFSAHDVTPISATSTNSATHFLPGYHASSLTSERSSFTSPVSDTFSSSPKPDVTPAWTRPSRTGLWGKKRVGMTGSPVESKQINMTFPGPPGSRGRWGRG